MPLLARAWALCRKADLIYAEALHTQLRDPRGTRWEFVLADKTSLVHVVGETTATEWWDYDEQHDCRPTSGWRKTERPGSARPGGMLSSEHRYLRVGLEWWAVSRSPPRSAWMLTWEDRHRVTIP